MESNVNALNWFETPVTDVKRAQDFYGGIFNTKMSDVMKMMGMQMIGFPVDPMSGKVGGALVKSDYYQASESGCLVYLNANPDIQTIIDKIEEFGGELLMPRTLVSEDIGYMAFFKDTEGNRVGLHAQH